MFPNQISFAKKIADTFLDIKIRSILAVALTQSGKTGTMLSLIDQVPHQHVFIITGLSSVEWMEQTRKRFPKHLHASIFHRNLLPSFVKKVKGLTNVLILIDENQIAFKEHQTIHNSFVSAGIMDIVDIISKNIRIVHFTATPSNTYDFAHHDFSKVVRMDQDSHYVSAFDLLDQDRILPYKDLCGLLPDKDYSEVSWKDPSSWIPVNPTVFDHIMEIKPFLLEPKYHIIRTSHTFHHDVTILNFMRVFPDAEFMTDMDLDTLLAVKPLKHTFLFIKEKLRCAKTLQKDHLGVLYERITRKPVMNTILQGLVGRLTGYHDNTDSVVFSNVELVETYKMHWAHSFRAQKNSQFIFIGDSGLPLGTTI